jgi:hypothetical protein
LFFDIDRTYGQSEIQHRTVSPTSMASQQETRTLRLIKFPRSGGNARNLLRLTSRISNDGNRVSCRVPAPVRFQPQQEASTDAPNTQSESGVARKLAEHGVGFSSPPEGTPSESWTADSGSEAWANWKIRLGTTTIGCAREQACDHPEARSIVRCIVRGKIWDD